MANTAFAGETTTITQDFGMRVTGAVKRAFTAVIRAREREVKRRVDAYLKSIGYTDDVDAGRF